MDASPYPNALGPYTAWMYGTGRSFDFFAAARAAAPHTLTAVVERPDGHAPTSDPEPLSGAGLTVPLVAPTLWSGLAAPRFLPVMMDGVSAQDLTSDSLSALFQSKDLAGVSCPAGGFGPSGGLTRISAGAPIQSDSLTPSADGAVTLAADPEVDPHTPLIVVGIIDDGIPFAHTALAGRIDAVWLQGMAPDGSGRVRFGREVTGSDIAQLRTAHGADEDAIYRAAGALGGVDRAASSLIGDGCHGAHTLGELARGSDTQVRIIAVDLPPDTTWDTSGHGKEALMLAAMHYIFDRADKLAAAYGRPTLPLVINLSYGYSGGGHDGQGVIEAGFDELISARRALAPTAFTMPAGNMYVDRTAAELPLSAGAPATPLAWVLPPDDRTSTFMEVWLPEGADAADVTMALHGPGPAHGGLGALAAELSGSGAQAGDFHGVPVTWAGKTVGHLTMDCTRSGRWRILAALAPTEALGDAAPSGRWHVALSSKAEMTVALRIQRDISYGRGFTGARQSYFDDPQNALFTREGYVNEEDTPAAVVKRAGSINGMATGATSLVVGAGHRDWYTGAELYSSAARTMASAQVDVSASVSASPAERGRLGLAARSGARHRMTGTSVAAPALGRALREVIADQAAGDVSDNYLSALSTTGKLADANPKARRRLGGKGLREG